MVAALGRPALGADAVVGDGAIGQFNAEAGPAVETILGGPRLVAVVKGFFVRQAGIVDGARLRRGYAGAGFGDENGASEPKSRIYVPSFVCNK